MVASRRTQSRLDRALSEVAFRRSKPPPKPAELFREIALGVAEEAGFTGRAAVQHATSTGHQIDFWEYVRTIG